MVMNRGSGLESASFFPVRGAGTATLTATDRPEAAQGISIRCRGGRKWVGGGGGRGGFEEEGAWSADGGGGGVERRWRLSTNQARACCNLKNFEDIFSRGKGPVPRLSFLPEQQVRVLYRIRV